GSAARFRARQCEELVGRVEADGPGATLSKCERQQPRATRDVQYAIAGRSAGERDQPFEPARGAGLAHPGVGTRLAGELLANPIEMGSRFAHRGNLGHRLVMIDVVLKPGRDRSLRRRHPWVMSGALASVAGDLDPGAWVRVLSAEGEVLGFGHASPHS